MVGQSYSIQVVDGDGLEIHWALPAEALVCSVGRFLAGKNRAKVLTFCIFTTLISAVRRSKKKTRGIFFEAKKQRVENNFLALFLPWTASFHSSSNQTNNHSAQNMFLPRPCVVIACVQAK